MPRNSSGNYTLPAGNPVVPNTLIETTWANPTMADLGAAITDSLDRYGRGGMLAQLKLADGTLPQPAFSFNSESSTGLLRPSAGLLQLSVLGVLLASFSAAGAAFPVGASFPGGITGPVSFTGDTTLNGSLGVGVAPVANYRINTRTDLASGNTSILQNTAYGTSAAIVSRVAGGTIGAPTATPIGVLANFVGGTTSDGATFFNTAAMQFLADAVPTVGSQPTSIGLFTTPVGSTGRLQRVWVDNAGKVGIGAAPVLQTLDVNGSIRAYGPNFFAPGVTGVSIGITGAVAHQCWTNSGGAADGKIWDLIVDTSLMTWRTVNDAASGAVAWMNVQRAGTGISYVNFPNGNVGVGIVPLDKLHVFGQSIRLQTDQCYLSGYSTAGVRQGYVQFNTGGTGLLIAGDNSNPVSIMTAGTTRVTVDNNGNVGIGVTATAGFRLDFGAAGGQIGGVTNIGGSSDAGAYTIWGGRNTINGAYIQLYGSANATNPNLLLLGNASTTRLGISADGRIFATSIHNNAAGAAGASYFASGTYTPAGFTGANINSCTPGKATWVRLGNVVHVAGLVNVNFVSASVGSNCRLALPVASNLAIAQDLSGTAGAGSTAAPAPLLQADPATDTALFTMTPTFAGGAGYTYVYQYEVL